MQATARLETQSSPLPSLLPEPTGSLLIPAEPAEKPDHRIHLSMIVPTYKEAKNVGEMVRQLTELLDPVLGDGYELIVVDDNSPDRTWEIAQALIPAYPKLRVMRRDKEKGLSTAVIRGWQAARGETLAVIDADLQHPPEVTVKLWKEIERGADLAAGSRHVEGGGVSDWAMIRRILSRGAQLIGLMILPAVVGRVTDPMSGYFMVRRSALGGVTLNPLGYKILIEVIGRGRIKWIGEVGYVFRERVAGESKVTSKVYVEYLRHLVRLRIDTLPLARFARFALVGFTGVFVDMGLLYLLSDPGTLHWGLTRSKFIAGEVAIINNFLWNDAWTFRDLTQNQHGLALKLRRLGKFNIVCAMGLLLNVGLVNLQFNLLGMNRYLANAIAILIVTAWNFWLNMKLSWRTAETDPSGAV